MLVFGWKIDVRKIIPSREARDIVISFKPLGMESWIKTCWCVFLVARGLRSGIATQETNMNLLKGWNDGQG